MTTSIVIEVRSDDEPLATMLREVAAKGEYSEEFQRVLIGLHQFEAQRLSERLGATRRFNSQYPRGRKKKAT